MYRLLTTALLLLTLDAMTQASEASKPNFVFVIADDCTFRDIGCYGGQAATPHIDKLATEGMRLTRCFQAAPMCSPTRHNIYTGLYPVKSGAYPNHTRAYDHVKSIVHYLTPLGYRVAQSGKKHIGPREVFPFEDLGGGGNPNMTAIDKLFAETAAGDKPICLFACSNEPHSPWNKGDASQYPPDEVKLPPYLVDTPKVREDFSNYLAEITYFDHQVGQILGMLDQHDLAKNTLVMIVSEQGNSFPFAKWTCYDHGLQSAMVVRWPDKVKPSSETNAMVEYVDIVPTFVDIAGGKPAKNLDGRSFVDVLKGKSDHHKKYAYGMMTTRGIINGNEAYAIRSVRDERFKLIHNLNYEEKFTNACTKSAAFQSMVAKAASGDEEARRLVDAYQHRPEFEFFDLQTDPLEMNNLASKPGHQETIARLKSKLSAWMADQGDEGIATERQAHERQHRRSNKKPKSQRERPKRQ